MRIFQYFSISYGILRDLCSQVLVKLLRIILIYKNLLERIMKIFLCMKNGLYLDYLELLKILQIQWKNLISLRPEKNYYLLLRTNLQIFLLKNIN